MHGHRAIAPFEVHLRCARFAELGVLLRRAAHENVEELEVRDPVVGLEGLVGVRARWVVEVLLDAVPHGAHDGAVACPSDVLPEPLGHGDRHLAVPFEQILRRNRYAVFLAFRFGKHEFETVKAHFSSYFAFSSVLPSLLPLAFDLQLFAWLAAFLLYLWLWLWL